jgi:energy-coupling factor transporter ATP-binding protein EcfA2
MSDDLSPEDLPPAYFLSLTLENVRCFGPEQTLDLTNDEDRPAQWTVLLGDNGTGKTTILQAIAGMQTIDSFTVAGDEQESKKVEPILSAGAEPFRSWRGRARRSSFLHIEVEPLFADGLTTDRADAFTSDDLQVGTGSSVFFPAGVEINCIGYGASRRMGENEFSDSGRASVVGLFSETETEISDAGKWLRELDYAAKSGKTQAERRRNQVKAILSDRERGILPNVDDLEFTSQEGDYSSPRVEFHTPYGWVTIDQLSLGYRAMIAWVVDLARRLFDRYPESDNPLAEPAVCLVDEIDLHLHPKWQRKIIDFLSERFPNTQFIVTAHSPLVVQAAQDANIALLRRVEVDDGDDYVEIHNDMEPVGNLRVDQILTSDLYGLESARPPQLDDLLEERQELLSKSELTDRDEERLAEIEQEIGDLPSGETREQREAMDFIKGVADRLENEEGTS